MPTATWSKIVARRSSITTGGYMLTVRRVEIKISRLDELATESRRDGKRMPTGGAMPRRVPVLAGLVTLLVVTAACSSAPPERQLVNDAAAALGGADRIRALKSIAVQGEGDAPNV